MLQDIEAKSARVKEILSVKEQLEVDHNEIETKYGENISDLYRARK